MTINELQEELIYTVEKTVEGTDLINKKGELAKLKGFKQALPFPLFDFPEETEDSLQPEEDFSPEELLFPYFICRVEEIAYPEELDDNPKAKIFLLFGLYDDDPKMKGYFTMLTILERVINLFRVNPVMGYYWCDKKMELAMQEDDSYPQFFGGIEMTWNLPILEMEEFA